MAELKTGLKGRAEVAVTHENTAAVMGSGALEVFATPAMVALMEKAALESVQPCLEEGQGTVGTRLEISHLAATPVGMTVRAESELVEVDRCKLVFIVTAWAPRPRPRGNNETITNRPSPFSGTDGFLTAPLGLVQYVLFVHVQNQLSPEYTVLLFLL